MLTLIVQIELNCVCVFVLVSSWVFVIGYLAKTFKIAYLWSQKPYVFLRRAVVLTSFKNIAIHMKGTYLLKKGWYKMQHYLLSSPGKEVVKILEKLLLELEWQYDGATSTSIQLFGYVPVISLDSFVWRVSQMKGWIFSSRNYDTYVVFCTFIFSLRQTKSFVLVTN